MFLSSISLLAAALVGVLGYHIARANLSRIRAAAGEPDSDFLEDSSTENRHTLGYLISGLLMIIGTKLTFNLVTPMGYTDHFALLLDAGILTFLVTGLILTWIDGESEILPTKIIYWGGGTALALLIAAAAVRGAWELLIPMAIGGIFYFVFYGLVWFWKPGALGFGDVRLSFFVGAILAFLSPESALVGFAAAWMLALAGICIAAVFGMIKEKTQIAFGPWMIMGAVVGLFWGKPIVAMLIPS